jgi:ABC-type oligopeptide transport system substrate-binding subunit/class 3 adenylate cyclase
MQCPRCNTENPQQAKFCVNCGARLTLVCSQCRTELPPQAKFCFVCGTQVAALPAAEGLTQALQRLVPREFAERLRATRGQVGKERRMVTILFSDVKGSTAMAEDLDPEDVMEIMDGAFDVLIEPIYRYEGTVARLMGDAILAFFGAPITHEDDPERACRAALEIIKGTRKYAARLEEERGIHGFNVRVGINTGLVVVGEMGSDLRVEYTAMGDAVNLAARMESEAEPGTILITEDTYKLIAPLFETEALGAIEVKGKAEPVSVYGVVSARVVPSKPRGVAGLESPLVGREAEFSALAEVVACLQAGVGGVVTIVGEAGIGKSRLVAELRKQARADLQWVEGRCLSYGTSIAYLLWLDVLRGLLGVRAEDSPVAVRDALQEHVLALCPDRLDDVYPYLGRLMSLPLEVEDETRIRDLEGEKIKAGTFRAVETLIERGASDRPCVLICEDLHWGDPTSMELLEQLLALTDHVPLLFICVFRPQTERGSWRIRETAARLYRHRHTDLWLDPLSASESETLVGNLLGLEGLSQKLKWRILSHAEGNPFYVEEIIRSLIDTGAIVRDEATGRWQATRDVADIAIPDTLHGVLMARIDRLREDTKRVLQMAAVIGRIFLYRVLAAIAKEERELDAHLLTLQREEMIRERARLPELEYIFKHHLTQEAAYNDLLKKERRVFHRQVAEALERLFPDRLEEQVGLLAHHWERAGEAEKATEYLLRAGDQARLTYAHQEAIDYYQRALAFLKEQEERERAARTLMKLGLTYHTAFDFRRSRQAYEEGFTLWQRAGEAQPPVRLSLAPHALRVTSPGVITLDPTLHEKVESAQAIAQLFSGLVESTPELDVVPDVAQSWEVSEGGRKYIFHLRDDVRWSDGAPLTARDFEYAWQRALDPATGSSLAAGLLYDVKGARAFHRGESEWGNVGIQAIEDLTLTIELEEPTGYFLHLLACWNIVTNGPFRLEAWDRKQSMVLVRNPEYHGKFAGNVQRVEISFPLFQASELSAFLRTYEADGLDMFFLHGLPPTEVDCARQRHAREYISAPLLITYYVVFDVSRPPFDDPRVRRAFALATDKKTLANVVMKGYEFPATGGFVPLGMPGHSAGIGLPYDPEQARDLLAEAGYPGGRGLSVIDVYTFERLIPNSEYLQAKWREILGVEFARLKRLTAEEGTALPHMILKGWIADYPDPDSFLRMGISGRLSTWHNEAYDRLVGEARQVMDQPARMELYQEADRFLIEEAVVVPFAYGRWHLLVKPWVRRFPTSAIRWWFFKDVIIEPH